MVLFGRSFDPKQPEFRTDRTSFGIGGLAEKLGNAERPPNEPDLSLLLFSRTNTYPLPFGLFLVRKIWLSFLKLLGHLFGCDFQAAPQRRFRIVRPARSEWSIREPVSINRQLCLWGYLSFPLGFPGVTVIESAGRA